MKTDQIGFLQCPTCGQRVKDPEYQGEATMQLQQNAFTSCDGIVANQLKWIEKYVNKNNYSSLAIDQFLRIYANIVNEFMKLVSMSYDLTTSNIESYNKTLISLNEYFFGIKEGRGEIERLTV